MLPSRNDILLAKKEKQRQDKIRDDKNIKQLHDMLIDTIKQNLNSNIFWSRDSFKINMKEWEDYNQVRDGYKGGKLDMIVSEQITPKLLKLGYSVDFENRDLFISIETSEAGGRV